MGSVQRNESGGIAVTTEFDYLGDTTVSKLFDMVLQLSVDLHVATHRLGVLELALVKRGALAQDSLETIELSTDETAALDLAREARLGRIIRIITEDGPAEHPLRDQWEERIKPKVST